MVLDLAMFATHRLVMRIICAKLFSNPSMHNKVMVRTGKGFTEVYAQSLSADEVYAQSLSADYDLDL